MFSATADYALRAMLFLARQPAARIVPADEVARAIGAPRNYLSKILYELRKAGLVTSVAGRTGGFALAVDSRRLSVATVVDCFDTTPPATTCLLGNRRCDPAHPCVAHERWSTVKGRYRDALEGTTIAALLGE
jgi:Rrf2 family protein